eukprot:NODE_3491_length_2027_cov_20.667895.p2 GENE.NODE_3491_length_2027_cov_20.667895~~NODE_3491_length_2027_cov_20.667895.p2  ORF type:complete len:302 (+),score=64.35 NODE_3491_length_2027_cov_20.667895:877-1782(+)
MRAALRMCNGANPLTRDGSPGARAPRCQTAQLVSGGGTALPLGLVALASTIYIIPPGLHTGSPLMTTATAQEGTAGPLSTDEEIALWHERKWALLAFMGVSSSAQYVAQSVELGTSLLLEENFGWRSSDIGTATGVSMLVSMPVLAVMDAWIRASAGCDTRFRRSFLSLISAMAGALLFLETGSFGVQPWLVMLVADALIFGFIAPVMAGLMTDMLNVSVEGSVLWSPRSIALQWALCMLGRGAAGPCSRWLIGAGGLLALAWNQIGFMLFASLTYRVCFASQMRNLLEKPTAPTSGNQIQ